MNSNCMVILLFDECSVAIINYIQEAHLYVRHALAVLVSLSVIKFAHIIVLNCLLGLVKLVETVILEA